MGETLLQEMTRSSLRAFMRDEDRPVTWIARKAGVSAKTVRKFLAGHDVSRRVLDKIDDVYGGEDGKRRT